MTTMYKSAVLFVVSIIAGGHVSDLFTWQPITSFASKCTEKLTKDLTPLTELTFARSIL